MVPSKQPAALSAAERTPVMSVVRVEVVRTGIENSSLSKQVETLVGPKRVVNKPKMSRQELDIYC